MSTFLMLGNYGAKAMKGISAKRTEEAQNIIKKNKGKILSLHALLGQHDIALMADFPDFKAAMKASIELGRATGIGFTTSPAVDVKEFDKLAEGK